MTEERLNPLTWLQGKFASLVHTHNTSDINNVSVVNVTVTYSDQSTGTIKLLQYTGS